MKIFGIILGLVLIVAAGLFAVQQKNPIAQDLQEVIVPEKVVNDDQVVNNEEVAETEEVLDESKFTAQFFKNISDTITYDHVSANNTPSTITGDTEVDDYIRAKAIARGYKLRHQADESRLVNVQGQRLQPEASTSLKQLQAAAKNQGMVVTFVSGYRSIAKQREIFLGKLGNYDKQKLLDGELDAKLDSILEASSVPGYSKHHTGYTVDIACNSYELTNAFMNTTCYKWLAKDNFKNARAYNFIPSYPVGIENQGPDPESWEFIWVPSGLLK